jgi:hypothetical protein
MTSANRTTTYSASSYVSGRISATANTTSYTIPKSTYTSATLTSSTPTPSRVANSGMSNSPAGIFALLGAAALAVMI